MSLRQFRAVELGIPAPAGSLRRRSDMPFDVHAATRAAVLDYFAARADRFAGLVPRVEDFFARPSLDTGRDLLRAYFRAHRKGDIRSLRMATWAFADKRAVRSIVASVLDDEAALAAIAA